MAEFTLRFTTIENLAEFQRCCDALLSSYNLSEKTLTGPFSEADRELAVTLFGAEIVWPAAS